MNFIDVREVYGKFMEFKLTVNSVHALCDFVITTPKDTIIEFFKDIIDHIEWVNSHKTMNFIQISRCGSFKEVPPLDFLCKL